MAISGTPPPSPPSTPNTAQLKYDLGNATNDAKEANWIKKQADAAPNHQITAQLAQQLHTVQQNYNTNVTALSTDLAASGLSKADTAHTADYINALTNQVNNTSMSLETGNDLDGALKQLGDTPGQFHDRISQIVQSNSKVLDVSNALAPNSDPSNAQAVQQAATSTQINPGDMEPYAAGHFSAPEGVFDLYDNQTPENSVANPSASLGPTTPLQDASTIGSDFIDGAAQYVQASQGQPTPTPTAS